MDARMMREINVVGFEIMTIYNLKPNKVNFYSTKKYLITLPDSRWTTCITTLSNEESDDKEPGFSLAVAVPDSHGAAEAKIT